MLAQNMSNVADHSGRSNAIYGSYKPAVQVGMQPPTACHMPTLLTSTKPANQQNADKESRADEGWLDDDESGSEEKGPSEDYTFFGIDFKPVLPDWWPVHAPGADSDVVSFHQTIAGVALCTFCGDLWHCLGVHGILCLC